MSKDLIHSCYFMSKDLSNERLATFGFHFLFFFCRLRIQLGFNKIRIEQNKICFSNFYMLSIEV
jgi:hypothetical protein